MGKRSVKWIGVATAVSVSLGGLTSVVVAEASATAHDARALVEPTATVVEGFENGLVPEAGVSFCGAPIDSSDGGGCFPVEGLAPGLQIEVPGTIEQEPLMLLGKGFSGAESTTLATVRPEEELVLSFTRPTNVVKFDLWSLNDPGTAQCTVSVDYVDADVPGSDSIAPCQRQTESAAAFSFGPGPDIKALTIEVTAVTNPLVADVDGVELIDAVRFGHETLSTPTPTPSPTPAPTPTPTPADRVAPNTTVKIEATNRLKRVVRAQARSNERGASFQCKLDRQRAYHACKASTRLRVKPGRHILRVRAVDRAGNIDRSPATARWITR